MKMILCMILSIVIKNVLCSANLRSSIYNLNTNNHHMSTATGGDYRYLSSTGGEGGSFYDTNY